MHACRSTLEDPTEVFDRLENSMVMEALSPLDASEALALRGEAHLVAGELDLARADLAQALAGADAWDAALSADPLDGASERAVQNVIGEWVGVHTLAVYAQACAQGGDALEAARAIEEFQSRSLRRGARELGRLHELTGVASAPLSRDDILAWAKSSDLGLITWVVGPDFGLAVHVDREGRASFARIERSRSELEDGARRLREALIAADSDAISSLSRELGLLLIPAELRERVFARAEPTSRLIALLHGPLESLPIEEIEVGGRSLADACTLSCSPGLCARAPRSASVASPRWSLLGAPDKSPLGALTGAKDELETLHATIGDSTLALGPNFDRAALSRALAKGGSLHVATHLAARTDASKSRFAPVGLELSNGDVFSADDVRDSASELELVILSSCASGGGRMLDAEGLQGLARAFLEVGARGVIATLWPVTDRGARDFALSLHRHLALGERPSAAVRAARDELRRAGAKAADWAAFRLLGQD